MAFQLQSFTVFLSTCKAIITDTYCSWRMRLHTPGGVHTFQGRSRPLVVRAYTLRLTDEVVPVGKKVQVKIAERMDIDINLMRFVCSSVLSFI